MGVGPEEPAQVRLALERVLTSSEPTVIGGATSGRGTTMSAKHRPGEANHRPRPGEECVELSLLLPAGQWVTLEQAASRQRVTVGQLLRGLLCGFLAAEHGAGLRAIAE